MRLLLFQFRERIAHLGDQGRDDLVEEAALGTQFVAMAAGAANDTAQHVATAFVGRRHTVSDQEAAGADMVSHHLQRGLAFIGAADGLGRSVEQALEQVDLIVRVDVLQHRADTFQAHASVHTRCRQRMQNAIRRAVELHENVIPDLDVAIAILFWRAGWAAPDVLAVIKENLGAWATGAGIAHGPEVVGSVRSALVITDTDHPLSGHADFLGPDVVRLVIGGIDRNPEFLLGQLQPFLAGEEFPGEMDGVALEIVAKTEVAEHFEERMVTCGIADVFQVVVLATGAHALLAGGGAGVGALLQAQEAVLELVHAGVGEQQRGIVVRNQGTGSDTGVPLLFEEAQESFTDFCAFHWHFPGKQAATAKPAKARIISGLSAAARP